MAEQRSAVFRDAPVEAVLATYLETIGDGAQRDACAERVLAALRAEPLARGCPTLAMLTIEDLEACRRALYAIAPASAPEVLAALRAFLVWAGCEGAHGLPVRAVERALASRDAASAA